MEVLKENHKLTEDKKRKKEREILSLIISERLKLSKIHKAQGINSQQLIFIFLYYLIGLYRHTYYVAKF